MDPRPPSLETTRFWEGEFALGRGAQGEKVPPGESGWGSWRLSCFLGEGGDVPTAEGVGKPCRPLSTFPWFQGASVGPGCSSYRPIF